MAKTKRVLAWVMALFMAHTMLTGPTARAQTLYTSNMTTAQTFLESGNLRMAEHYFMEAFNEASATGEGQLLDAQMGLVDVLKFWQPVEAQRWANKCEAGSYRDADTRLRFLLQNACISFALNNKRQFETLYDSYRQMLTDDDSLQAVGLQTMESMNQAIHHYYDEALRRIYLEPGDPDPLTRQNIEAIIYQLKKDTLQVIASLQKRAEVVDSLTAAHYNDCISAANTTASMTRAQLKAQKDSSTLLKIVLGLAAFIIVMMIWWIFSHHKIQERLKKKNSQLSTALMMANETDQMKTEFVSRVSHEIRTPLNAITGFNEVLNTPGIEISETERTDLLNRINENVTAITKIVNEMLKTAEVESAVEYTRDDEVLCNQFFSDIFYSHSGETSSNVQMKFISRIVNRDTMQINAQAVKEILEHMIHNAIKFTTEGTIELFCHKERGMIHLTLTDTGCGIPDEMQDAVFEQFAKADAFKPGIGLGLTVSRNIARKMGGDLVLDKTYTQGARFILTLPVT